MKSNTYDPNPKPKKWIRILIPINFIQKTKKKVIFFNNKKTRTWIGLGPYLKSTPRQWFFFTIGETLSPKPAAAGELLLILAGPERPLTMPENHDVEEEEDEDEDDVVDEVDKEVEEERERFMINGSDSSP